MVKKANLKEKIAAWPVTTPRKVKINMEIGVDKQRRRCGALLSFRKHIILPILKKIQKVFVGKGLDTKTEIRKSLLNAVKEVGCRKRILVPRLIPFEPTTGGILPLIPIFVGLSF